MPSTLSKNLFGLTLANLEQLALDSGQPRFRGRQIYRALYARRVRDLNAMTDLDRNFRAELLARFAVALPKIQKSYASRDGSVRHLLRLGDGKSVEAVYMPFEDRATLCISSQVGCAVDCRFCFTGLLGVSRNLTAGEMVGQVLALAEPHEIARGARLMLLTGNSREIVEMYIACSLAGVICVPVNILTTARELIDTAADCTPAATIRPASTPGSDSPH